MKGSFIKFETFQKQLLLEVLQTRASILTGKTHVLEFLLNKVAGLKACNFVKKRLQHKCFTLNIAKFLTDFFIEYLKWLLLTFFFVIWNSCRNARHVFKSLYNEFLNNFLFQGIHSDCPSNGFRQSNCPVGPESTFNQFTINTDTQNSHRARPRGCSR